MKHSKLPFKQKVYHYSYCGQREIRDADDQLVATLPPMSPENAEFIVKACNEHDTLKAKLDDAVEALKPAWRILQHFARKHCECDSEVGNEPCEACSVSQKVAASLFACGIDLNKLMESFKAKELTK